MPKMPVVRNMDVSTYPALFRLVRSTLIDGQKRIEQEKVRTYWETGRLIQAHILKNKGRAEYGAEVVGRLADDLNLSGSTLHRCIKFFVTYPDLRKVATSPQLGWAHYQELLSIADIKQRAELEDAITKGGLSIPEVRARKNAARSETKETSVTPGVGEVKPLVPLKGQLYTYQIQKRKVLGTGTSELVVDLGFAILHNVEPRLLSAFSAGDIVASLPKEDAYRFAKSDRTAKDLYTYQALIEKVIDGDTLKVHIDLGFDMWVKQTLRLRGIDCPELKTTEGDEAKAFVQSLLKEADTITIRSSRSDKYDRYLADVFIPQESGEDLFLNNLLLEKGHAGTM